jgi:hypothetical protein
MIIVNILEPATIAFQWNDFLTLMKGRRASNSPSNRVQLCNETVCCCLRTLLNASFALPCLTFLVLRRRYYNSGVDSWESKNEGMQQLPTDLIPTSISNYTNQYIRHKKTRKRVFYSQHQLWAKLCIIHWHGLLGLFQVGFVDRNVVFYTYIHTKPV